MILAGDAASLATCLAVVNAALAPLTVGRIPLETGSGEAVRIVGRGGETIQKLQRVHGVRIQLIDSTLDQAAVRLQRRSTRGKGKRSGATSAANLATIQGMPDAVAAASAAINTLLSNHRDGQVRFVFSQFMLYD